MCTTPERVKSHIYQDVRQQARLMLSSSRACPAGFQHAGRAGAVFPNTDADSAPGWQVYGPSAPGAAQFSAL